MELDLNKKWTYIKTEEMHTFSDSFSAKNGQFFYMKIYFLLDLSYLFSKAAFRLNSVYATK